MSELECVASYFRFGERCAVGPIRGAALFPSEQHAGETLGMAARRDRARNTVRDKHSANHTVKRDARRTVDQKAQTSRQTVCIFRSRGGWEQTHENCLAFAAAEHRQGSRAALITVADGLQMCARLCAAEHDVFRCVDCRVDRCKSFQVADWNPAIGCGPRSWRPPSASCATACADGSCAAN